MKRNGIHCEECGANITRKTRHRYQEDAHADWHAMRWRCHDCWRRMLGREIPEREDKR